MTRKRGRTNKATRCTCCEPGRFIDVSETIKGLRYWHSDDGTEAEKKE